MNKQTEYGFAEIRIGDEVHSLVPSFFNISKIGTPTEIVQKMYDISYRGFLFTKAFDSACEVLHACGLSFELTGWLHFSERQKKFLVRQGILPIEDVFVLAEHCMLHGVIGSVESNDRDKDKKGEPLHEFNIHNYLVDAVEFLGVTMEYAENMTMTQFVKLVKAKNENMALRDPNSLRSKEKDIKNADQWYKDRIAALNKKKGIANVDPLEHFNKQAEKLKNRGNR